MLPTTPPNLTAQGTILGTFQYMAPEQLEGQEADARTDIFAFGAVLYEMLTGRKAFEGKTHASLIAAILKDEPRPHRRASAADAPAARPHRPPMPREGSRRALAERERSHARIAVDQPTAAQRLASAASPVARRARRGRLILGVAAALAGLVVGIVATTLVARFGAVDPRNGRRQSRACIVSVSPAEHLQALPADRTTVEGRPSRTAMAWSPDGRSIVFSAVQGDRQQLYLRALDQLAATPIAGTEGASSPFFSPDGRWVGFWSGGALKKTSSRWQRSSDDDLRDARDVRRELGIG